MGHGGYERDGSGSARCCAVALVHDSSALVCTPPPTCPPIRVAAHAEENEAEAVIEIDADQHYDGADEADVPNQYVVVYVGSESKL